ncbi:MAG: hypothetical protein RH862_05230 [Leptospiraceae bacterium]
MESINLFESSFSGKKKESGFWLFAGFPDPGSGIIYSPGLLIVTS